MGRVVGIRMRLWWLPLLCGLWPPAPALAGAFVFPERPVLIFVIAGQSNATGLALVTELEDGSAFVRDDILTWRGEQGFQTLRPGQGNDSSTFGPELTLGATLADALPARQVLLLKHAPPGSGLAQDWAPGGFAFDGLVEKVDNVVDSLDAFSIEFEFGGTFWVQGERDAQEAQSAADYGQNLLDLMSNLRNLTGADPFTVASISASLPAGSHPFIDGVRAAQRNVTGADPLAPLVETDDLPLRDRLHYTGPGYLALGTRLAQAHLALASVPEPSASACLVAALLALTTLRSFSRAPGDRRRS